MEETDTVSWKWPKRKEEFGRWNRHIRTPRRTDVYRGVSGAPPSPRMGIYLLRGDRKPCIVSFSNGGFESLNSSAIAPHDRRVLGSSNLDIEKNVVTYINAILKNETSPPTPEHAAPRRCHRGAPAPAVSTIFGGFLWVF